MGLTTLKRGIKVRGLPAYFKPTSTCTRIHPYKLLKSNQVSATKQLRKHGWR